MNDLIKQYERYKIESDNLEQEYLEFKAKLTNDSRNKFLDQLPKVRKSLNLLVESIKDFYVGRR